MMQNAIPSIVTEPPPRLDDVNLSSNVKPPLASKNPGISVNTQSRPLPTFIIRSPVASSNAVSPTARSHFNDLPDSVVAIDAHDVEAITKFVHGNEGNTLIIDIRPYNNYSASRLINAYNICIPTTLLKRPAYDLLHVTNTSALPRHVKDRLTASEEPLSIMVYDANSGAGHISFGLFQTVQKFLKEPRFTVAYLDGGFQDLPDSLKDTSAPSSATTPISPKTPSHPQMIQTVDVGSNDSLGSGPDGSRESSPFLSGFTLPSATASNQKMLMSIKKTLPKIDTTTKYTYNFRFPENFEAKKDKLPLWLSFFATHYGTENQNDKLVSVLSEKFNKLEKSEQIRLSMAISNSNNKDKQQASANLCNVIHSELSSGYCSPSAPCPHCDKIHYTIPKGVEYGYKNRYHNIWPYEHSRVKLISSPSCVSPSSASKKEGDDYFNANYIKCKQLSKTEYIATQSPLEATLEDFWNTVWYNEVKGIICLNKPSVFTPNAYYDDRYYEKSKLAVKIGSTEKEKAFTIRKIKLEKNGVARDVYHFAFADWPDFGVPDNFDDVSRLIQRKNEKMQPLKQVKCKNPDVSNLDLLVHCSAGCGRTGCFITLDMVNECFKGNGNGKYDPWGERDLIYKAVQLQRQQRIAMVQTLDQFIYCYESVLHEVCKSYTWGR